MVPCRQKHLPQDKLNTDMHMGEQVEAIRVGKHNQTGGKQP